MHWTQVLLILGTVHESLCVREGGSLRRQLTLSQSGRTVPGIQQLSELLENSGQHRAAEVVEENGVAVAGGIVFATLVLTLLCVYCCCCSSRTAVQEEPSSEGGAGGTAVQAKPNFEELPSPQKLSTMKREKTRMLLEQAMQKQKLEKLIQSILELEAEMQAQQYTVNMEDVQKRADNALKATEMLTERSLLSALAYVAPLAVQGNRVYEAMEFRRKAAQEKAAKLAWEQTETLCKDMQDIFGVDEELRNGIFSTVKGIEIPSVATLLSSATAPSKLRFLMVFLQLSIAVQMLYVLMDIFTLVVDRHLPCGSRCLFWIFSVDLAVTGCCMMIGFSSLRHVGRVVAMLDTPPMTADDPVKAFRLLLDYYMTVGAEALDKYNEYSSSFLNRIASLSIFFNLCWMIFATNVVFNTPWANCATAGLFLLRVRVCFFLIFLFPVVVHLVWFFVGSYLSSESFKLGLIATADSIDSTAELGVPLAGIVVQSMMVSGPRDLTYMHLRRCELRKYELSLEETQAKETLTKVESEKAKLEAEWERLKTRKHQEAEMTDDELRAKHLQAKDAILQDAEKVFMKMSSRAEELTKTAAEQVKKWEAEGVGVNELLESGMSLSQVQEYLEAAQKQAHESMTTLSQDPSIQQAIGQLRETAQAGYQAAQDRAQDPSVQQALGQMRETAQAGYQAAQGQTQEAAAPTQAPPPGGSGQ